MLTRLVRWSTFLALVGVAPALLAQQQPPPPPEGIVLEPDIVYGKGGDVELKLDLARPEKLAQPTACIVVIHGGAWRGGNKRVHVGPAGGPIPGIYDFAKAGYVSVSVGYRLIPVGRFPAQVEDVKCAVRFLRANAEKYHIDPQRIGAIGFSAGAHLSMMLGTMDKEDGLEGEGGYADQSSKVQAVVAFFGPTDLTASDIPPASVELVTDFIGGGKSEKLEAWKRASPISYVTLGDAPTLIFQGTKDPLVPHTQATLYADALTKAGVPGRVELLLGAGHGWGDPEKTRSVEQAIEFFGQRLKHLPSSQ
jgi:acetyl esterase/lipase